MLIKRWTLFFSIWLVFFCFSEVLVTAQNPAAEKPAAKADQARPAITSLPAIDARIHQAMQSRSYDEAVAVIDAELAEGKKSPQDYLLYLKGIALTEAEKYDEAIKTFEELQEKHPDSSWFSRSRFACANVYVLRRQYIDAGAIYQKEAERLLSRDRKDELAGVYLEFADRYFQGVPARDPSQQKKPDYKQALTYYSEAVKLGPTIGLRQKIEFRIARCHQELGTNDQAIAAYQAFLSDHAGDSPRSGTAAAPEMQSEAKFNLGAVQLAAGQRPQARKTWQDFLASAGENPGQNPGQNPGDDPGKGMAELLAKAKFSLAHTYGMPSPSTIGDLELGVAAAESFLQQYPDHQLAAQAELEIAQGYSNNARHVQAIQRLNDLIENPNYADSDQVPIARRMLGSAYLSQSKFDEGIAAWKSFLDSHPTDPQWSTVQKQIIDAEFAKAADARSKHEYDKARELWQTFLNKYPLDNRAPEVLTYFGDMKHAKAAEIHNKRVAEAREQGRSAQSVKLNDECEKLFLEAIADWRRVVTKYPGHGSASRAAFLVGQTLEDRLGRLKEALEAYKEVKGNYASQAQQRISRLTSPQLEIVTERKFRSDEQPRIKLTTRNLEKVTVKAYRIDMTDYFRKMHLASGVETLDIALIDPDQQFEYQVKDYQEFQLTEGDVEIPVAGPGVTAVTVASEKLEATTMLVVSDLDVIVKSSRNELFLFAQNMKTGKPIAGVSVLISDGSEVFAEELTADDGILQKSYDQLKSVKDLRVFAAVDGHVASTVNDLNGLDFAVGLSPRGYLFTDRPAYRAGQLVNIKGIVRWVDGDRFTFAQGEKFSLDVYDARGRQLQSSTVALNGFGTINDNIVLPETAPQGDYRIHLHRASSGPDDKTAALSFETRFKVTDYKLEPIDVEIDLDKDVYYRGEKVSGDISIAYYYGTPLADETVQYRLADGELITAKTDENGKVAVSLDTARFSESQTLQLMVHYPDRGLTRTQAVYLATRGFAVTVSTVRDVYISGETFETLFQVTDPAGKPVETDLKVEVFQKTNVNGQPGERLVETHQLATKKDDGQARQTLAVDSSGMYIVRATGADQFGNDVSGQTQVRVSGDKDSVRLRILADRHSFDVGDDAQIKIHWREKPALALVTFEGAKILGYQLVNLKSGENMLTVPMEADFAPNFFLSVAVMQRNEFHAATSQFGVAQQLRLTLKPEKTQLRPGEDLSLDIEATDAQGKPVQAELSLAMVQTNLLDVFSDVQGVIDEFFSSDTRRASIRQSTSCTFKYRPSTRGVSEFLLAEAERVATLEREARALAAMGRVGNRVDFDANVAFADEIMPDLLERGGDASPNDAAMLQAQVTRNQLADVVPQIRFRTEIRDGRQVQVPYTVQVQVEQLFSVPLGEVAAQQQQTQLNAPGPGVAGPGFGQLGTGGFFGGAQAGQTAGAWGTTLNRGVIDQLQSRQSQSSTPIDLYVQQRRYLKGYVNGLTADGKFMALNNRGEDELQRLVTERGMQLFPMLAHAETAFWNPTIVTDEHGKANLTIPMPARSTAWRLRGKAINTKTLSGQAEVDLITRKKLFGDMKLPTAFTSGDKATVPVQIHNSADGAKPIEVKLKVTLGDKSTEQSKTIDVQGPGITEVDFELEFADAGEAKFVLQVSSGNEITDTISEIVDVRPYGFPVYSTASATSSQSTVALIQLDKKLDAQNPTLEIVLGADVNRSLLESVLDDGSVQLLRCGLPTSGPLERSVSDILGGVAMLKTIGDARDADTPEAQALSGRITGAVAQLISAQHDDGGWTWSGRVSGSIDRLLSARIMWALSTARKAGFAVAQDRYGKGQAFIKSAFSSSSQRDLEGQTVLLHAMAASDCGDFAFANRLYRERNRLSNSALAHLALALSSLNHPEMAREILELVEFAEAGENPRSRGQSLPWMASEVELRAMYLLALQAALPRSPEAAKMADWLIAARVGTRWPIEKANGPAIAALAAWFARTQHANEKYKLSVAVNDSEIDTFTIDPNKDGSRRITVDSELLRADKPQRIEFKLDGRGQFSYSAVMTGFVPAGKIVATTKDWKVDRRYEPAKRMFDGREVPRGFGVVSGSYSSFTNLLTQLPVGRRGEVTLSPRRYVSSGSDQRFDYLVLTESIPAGCSVLEGSVTGTFERYEIEPGQITFYIGNLRHPGDIRYTLIGYVPGEFRVAQSILRSFYRPSQFAISKVNALTVLDSDQESADKYRLTPDELYHFGRLYFEKENYEQAHKYLTQLFEGWRLDADNYKNTVQWLFKSSLAKGSHADTVKYFEILKERFPDVELSFEDILQVAKSYREIGEYERSYLVYRATVEGSFERESQVAGFLNARGQFVRSVQAMERLLRDYPAESYVEIATHALAQEVYRRAPQAGSDKNLKDAGITRVDLINAAIQMLDHLVTTWPEDPANDEASFALATALIDLDQYEPAIARCQRYASRYPESRLLDSFWYMIGYCHFELEHHQQALEMCRKVAETTFPVPKTGGTRAADNKWEAVYIMGQINHSLGKAADAIAEYARVEERFADAAEAIKFFSRKEIALDEVTTIKPDDPKKVTLRFRNIPKAAIKIYRIDLMKFGLMQRNLDRITAINLAGIKPYHEATIELGDGKDYRDRERDLSLPLDEEGAYLLVCRGENHYASGLILVSPLRLLVSEDVTSGRVRVSVKDTTDDSFVGDVHVKVIGSANEDFQAGETDLRGLFIADDVKGICTAIAVSQSNRYAFYRGQTSLQGVIIADQVQAQTVEAEQAKSDQAAAAAPEATGKDVLRSNIFGRNTDLQEIQKGNYEGLLNNGRQGVQTKEAY